MLFTKMLWLQLTSNTIFNRQLLRDYDCIFPKDRCLKTCSKDLAIRKYTIFVIMYIYVYVFVQSEQKLSQHQLSHSGSPYHLVPYEFVRFSQCTMITAAPYNLNLFLREPNFMILLVILPCALERYGKGTESHNTRKATHTQN